MRILSCTILALSVVPVGAETSGGGFSELREALNGGKTSLFVRARNENVDSDAFTEPAHANTLRIALGYETKSFYGFSMGAQFEGVYSLGDEHYNSGFNGVTTRPLVSDATETDELQQAYLKYAPVFASGLVMTAGRQEINLENQRFIGAVGWRQDWQSFDALSVAWKPTSSALLGAEFFYAYLTDVHRITPEDSVAGDIDMESHAVSLAYSYGKVIRAMVYDYLIDFRTAPAQVAFRAQSTQTMGARATGTWKIDDLWSVIYAAEYAKQADYANNPNQVDVDYILAEVGGGFKALTLKIGYEMLGGHADEVGNKFTTPLATAHAFQGWADMFLATPAAGIEDVYLWVAGPLPFSALDNIRVGAVFHDFSANDGNDHYGSEIDLLLEYSVTAFDPKLIVGAKYARYSADDGKGSAFPGTTAVNADTEKTWIYTQYSF